MYQPLYLRIYIYCRFLCTAVYSLCKYHEHTLVNVSVCCWWKKDINQTLFKHCHFIIIFICLLCVTVSACQNLGLCRYLTLGLSICIRDYLTPRKNPVDCGCLCCRYTPQIWNQPQILIVHAKEKLRTFSNNNRLWNIQISSGVK